MKSATTALKNLLATRDFVKAELYTLTLNGGQVIRWAGHDQALTWSGNSFALGPLIDRSTISDKMGLEASTLDISLTAREGDAINGVPLLQFISKRGLDGANVKLERAFAPDWNSPITGVVTRFAGRITSVGDIRGSSCNVTVSSWSILLNVNYPPNVYQSACLHTVYDTGCTLNKESFKANMTVALGITPTTTSFRPATPLGVTGYWTQGFMIFTSGANSGLRRTVKTWDGTTFEVIPALPIAPASGDAFTVYAGCDLTHGTCITKFNNRSHFKGTPFVPIPETAV